MSAKEFKGIMIDGEQLASVLAYGNGERCLDFTTGKIVLADECPEAQTGDGRIALSQGKRYIRIPVFDEIRDELKARYDDWEFGDYEDNEELLPDNPEASKVREILGPLLDAEREPPEYKEWCDDMHSDLAAEESAFRWIASLRPTVMVGWFEDGLGVTQVYDPDQKEWVDAM